MVIEELTTIHFIGIGGAGMSGLATILLQLGCHVSGSDLKESSTTALLENIGAKIFIGHKQEYMPKETKLVVVSTAIPKNNPEILAAQKLGVPIVHRGEMLGRLMSRQKGIAVSGAHGKTTTTAMICLILSELDRDPTIYVGGHVAAFGSNARLGKGEYFVAEADESDGSFLRLDPHIAIVTNVENDHLDHYGSEDKIKEAFRQFVRKVPPNGLVVFCNDDPYLRSIDQAVTAPVITYAIDNEADLTADRISFDGGVSAEIRYEGKLLGMLKLSVPGRHNLSNALAAVAVALKIGLPFNKVAEALGKYQGVNRRFQTIGRQQGIWVVDDYAHHPTEIDATLNAARSTAAKRVVAVFQPHRYSRTRQLYKEFSEAFGQADIVVLDEVYSAGEAPICGVSSDLIYQILAPKQKVYFINGKEDIVDFLEKLCQPGDLVLTLGAGDIWQVAQRFVNRLQSKERVAK